MLVFNEAALDGIVLHKVGNKSREEDVRISKAPLNLDDSIKPLLMHYFLSSFKSEEYYNLTHDSDIELNAVYSYVSKIFDDPTALYEQSINLAKHLYDQSSHPKINAGEFYVTYISNCFVFGEITNAIGIFKSESRDTFLKIYPNSDDNNYNIDVEDGININKLDKGCLIFETEKERGYMVALVDANSKNEAAFWKDEFVKVKAREDDYYHTQNMINLYKSFVTEELAEEEDLTKIEQSEMIKSSVKYFKKNDDFDLDTFTEEVIQKPDYISKFKDYKGTYQASKNIEIEDDFEISDSAVKKNSKNMKTVLKLDKNFSVFIHGGRELLAKGFDNGTGMNFYKLFFSEEN